MNIQNYLVSGKRGVWLKPDESERLASIELLLIFHIDIVSSHLTSSDGWIFQLIAMNFLGQTIIVSANDSFCFHVNIF